jgi:hypothetical protein
LQVLDQSGVKKKFDTQVAEEPTENKSLFENQKVDIISSSSKLHDMLFAKKDMENESIMSYRISVQREESQKKVRPSTHHINNV